jgi:hypothetical protein
MATENQERICNAIGDGDAAMIAPAEISAPVKLLLAPTEAAESLRICEKILWSLTQPRGPIPCVRLGRAVRYSPGELQKWITSRSQEASQ